MDSFSHPTSDMVTGKAALESFWQSILDMGISGIELRTGELEGTRRSRSVPIPSGERTARASIRGNTS